MKPRWLQLSARGELAVAHIAVTRRNEVDKAQQGSEILLHHLFSERDRRKWSWL